MMIGLGLIENIAEENILKLEDVDDTDGEMASQAKQIIHGICKTINLN